MAIILEPSIPTRVPKETIKVGFLTPTLLFGGAERWVASLAAGLDPKRFQVMGVATRDRGRIFPPIADKISKRTEILQGSELFLPLARRCDVVITWGIFDLSMLKDYVCSGGRVVVTSHGHCDWTVDCLRQCIPFVTDWTAVSNCAAESFPEKSLVTIIHNGVEESRCIPDRSREEVRREWGAKSNEKLIGYVGRLSGEKSPLAAVVAAKKLGHPFRPVFVGGGPDTKIWITEARRIFIDTIYQQPVENVGNIYQAIDCFVLASPAEGFSIALAEAWYCKCPVVATPVGATEVQKTHGKMNIEVPVGASPDQLAKGVLEAISPENKEVIEHAHKVVKEFYTERAMCKRWEDYLSSIFTKPPTFYLPKPKDKNKFK